MRHLFLTLSLLLGSVVSVQAAPVCVTDDAGRSVCPKKTIKRVVSLSPGSTELVFAAGAGSLVVGVDEHSDYPADVESIARIGGYPNTSVESIVALQPDLIVAWAGGNRPQVTSMLESMGTPLFYIKPSDFNDVASAIQRLGVVFGTTPQAQQGGRNCRTSLQQHCRAISEERAGQSVL